jgi:hypothetical protein
MNGRLRFPATASEISNPNFHTNTRCRDLFLATPPRSAPIATPPRLGQTRRNADWRGDRRPARAESASGPGRTFGQLRPPQDSEGGTLKFARLRAVGGRPGTGLAFGAPQPPRGHAPAISISTPIIRAATSGLSPSCTRHARFQGRMIQLAGVIFSHAPRDSRATAHVEKTVRLFMNGLIAWRLRQTMQKSRNPKSRFDF